VLLTERLRKEFPHLLIVVEFRDEWLATAIDLVAFSRSERARKLARDAEASAIKHATAIVAATEPARREIGERYPHESRDKFCLIPNGYDATRLSRTSPAPQSGDSGKIIVAHIGSVYTSTEPTTLVEALEGLSEELKCRFRFRFIGHIEDARYRQALSRLGDMVELKGYLPQREALQAMNNADYALLIQHGRLNIAAKLYDYIGGGKPVLATINPDGPERPLIEELRAGWWAGSRDVEGIRRLFVNAASPGCSLKETFNPDIEKIGQYERKALARKYAALLHDLAGQCQAQGELHPQLAQGRS
jgi:hypothetical protein